MSIQPDSKLKSRIYLDYLTVVVFAAILAAIVTVIIAFAKPQKLDDAASVIWGIALGLIVLGWIVIIPVVSLWVKNLSFIIEEDRVTIHKGILTKIQQNIPYRAITDFQLHRSLYERFLGIGSIRIQTAGKSHDGTGYEGKLSGLLDWDSRHADLRTRVKHLHPLSESAAVTEPATKDTQTLILEELRAIRKGLEK